MQRKNNKIQFYFFTFFILLKDTSKTYKCELTYNFGLYTISNILSL